MLTLDWLEGTLERLARGFSARRAPTLSHLELWNVFFLRVGPTAPNGTPDRDTWQQVMHALWERDRATRAEARERRLQAREEGQAPALAPPEPRTGQPTAAELDAAYARIRAHHLMRKELGQAESSMTKEAEFFASDKWKPGEPPLTWRPGLSTLKRQQRRWNK